MAKRFRLLICCVAVGVIPITLTGCGAAPSPAIPGSVSAEAFHAPDGRDAYRTIYAFKKDPRDGSGPNGKLVAIGGVLYGTTYFGGRGHHGNGTVFSVTTSGEERVLHSFNRGFDGINPNGGLVAVDGVLYGTTYGGGTGCRQEEERGCGTVFAITPAGQEHVVYRFKGGTDGSSPAAGTLVWLDGRLYGTTSLGGTTSRCSSGGSGTGCGTVFSVDTSGNERVAYRFRGDGDGGSPNGSLLALNGKLYGTTYTGGAAGSCDYNCGILFEVTTSGSEKVLHRFAGGSDGSNPAPGLVSIDGVLYGTTAYEGACCGTVFKATTSGAESAIYDFRGSPDAAAPNGMLVADHSLLYGTAMSGGEVCGVGYYDSGAIFAVSTAGAEHVVHSFSCKSIFDPSAGLLPLGHAMYGTADEGGRAPQGSVFALTP
jgi:uncharacterized repeat protein (TIGR03803 family)